MRGSTQCSTTRACSAHISQRSFLSSFLELKETKWATSHHFLGWPEDAKWSWHFSQNRGFKRALAQVCGTLILVRPSGDSCRGRKQGYEDGPGGIFNTGSELLGYPVGS